MGSGHVVNGFDQDAVKRRQRAQQVALFRYQLICPALEPGLSTKQRGKLVRGIAGRSHDGPFGGQVRYSRDTLDRWIRRYRAGGFDALSPSIRQVGTRIDGQVFELAAALKRENPGRTAAQVVRILRASTGWAPSESTLLRHFHRLELMGPAAGQAVVFGRFEADAPNDRWVGDALHGPKVAGRKVYLFAFLDDHSRLAVGYRFGFAEDTVRLAAALEPALAARGVPGSAYVDNGSAFVDEWLLRACGKLGIRLVHSTPHRPQGRGKIERFWRTVNDQFLVEVHDSTAEDIAAKGMSPAAALLELNGLFTAWVETAYHHNVHSETGQTPMARWTAGWDRAGHGPVMPAAGALTEAFLWSAQRTVTKTATVSLHGNTLPGRGRAGRSEGRNGVLPVQPGTHRDPLPGQVLWKGVAAQHHPARPPEGPPRDTGTRAGAAHRDRLPGHGRRHPPPAGRRGRDDQLRRPLPAPTRPAPKRSTPARWGTPRATQHRRHPQQ